MRFLRNILFTFYFLLFTFLVNAQTANYISHTIASGETLTALAKQYHTTVGNIMRLNHMNTQSVLTVGEVVKIPSTQNAASKALAIPAKRAASTDTAIQSNGTPILHTVAKGESLYTLAKEFHTTIPVLKSWNKMTGNTIIDGHTIIVGYQPFASTTPYSSTQKMQPAATQSNQITTQPSISPSAEMQPQQQSQAAEEKPTVQMQPQVQSPAGDSTSSTTTETSTNISSTATTEINTSPTVSTSQPSQTEIGNMQNPEGYFTSAFGIGTEGRSIQTASGTSMTFKTASGWNDKKYYILMNNVPPGSIVKIMAGNYKTIFAKVLWSMTAMKENEGLDFRISTAAASALGLSEAKFPLTVTFFE